MKISKLNNMMGDLVSPKDRVRSTAMTKALASKKTQGEQKDNIKAAHKRIRKEGVDFNKA